MIAIKEDTASGLASGANPFRLLLVEDSPAYADLVREMLAESWEGTLELERVGSAGAACDYLADHHAECVLLDLQLPDARGPEAVGRLQDVAGDVPVVVLSGQEDERVAFDAVQGGAQDYLLKSYADGNLLRRAIRYAVERKRAQLKLTHQALHDALTGLPNRTLFLERLWQALARADRSTAGVALLFLDLDGFKPINDSLGHEAGDRVLTLVARRLEGLLREDDTVARFGGDEFMLLCEGLPPRRRRWRWRTAFWPRLRRRYPSRMAGSISVRASGSRSTRAATRRPQTS